MNSAFDTDDDRYLPDPDAVDIRIECDRDTEAEVAAIPASPGDEIATEAATCPTCGGCGRVACFAYVRTSAMSCPTCHGTGTEGGSE